MGEVNAFIKGNRFAFSYSNKAAYINAVLIATYYVKIRHDRSLNGQALECRTISVIKGSKRGSRGNVGQIYSQGMVVSVELASEGKSLGTDSDFTDIKVCHQLYLSLRGKLTVFKCSLHKCLDILVIVQVVNKIYAVLHGRRHHGVAAVAQVVAVTVHTGMRLIERSACIQCTASDSALVLITVHSDLRGNHILTTPYADRISYGFHTDERISARSAGDAGNRGLVRYSIQCDRSAVQRVSACVYGCDITKFVTIFVDVGSYYVSSLYNDCAFR